MGRPVSFSRFVRGEDRREQAERGGSRRQASCSFGFHSLALIPKPRRSAAFGFQAGAGEPRRDLRKRGSVISRAEAGRWATRRNITVVINYMLYFTISEIQFTFSELHGKQVLKNTRSTTLLAMRRKCSLQRRPKKKKTQTRSVRTFYPRAN